MFNPNDQSASCPLLAVRSAFTPTESSDPSPIPREPAGPSDAPDPTSSA